MQEKPLTLTQRLRSALPFSGLSLRTRRFFYTELGQMLDAGIPPVRSLNIIGKRHFSRRLRRAVPDMSRHIEEGGSLTTALARHPLLFPAVETRLIEVAEFSGSLPAALSRIAEFLERISGFWRKFLGGLIYPAFLLITAFILIPIFQSVVLSSMAGIPSQPVWTILSGPLLTLLYLLGFSVFWRWIKTFDGIRYRMHSLVLYVPIIGSLARKIAHARFANLLACLYSIGVPVPETISRAAFACGNEAVARRILRALPIVKTGGSLHEAMVAAGEFTPLALSVVEVGEASGKIDASLQKYAEHENQSAVTTMNTLSKIVPVLVYMIVLGILAMMVIKGFTSYFNSINTIIE